MLVNTGKYMVVLKHQKVNLDFILHRRGFTPFRCRIRPPGLYHLMGIDKMCKNLYLLTLLQFLDSRYRFWRS